MRREHIADGWWTLPGQPGDGWPGTKNAATHRIWLAQSVRDIIAALDCGDDTGFVFGPTTDLSGTMRSICRELNVPRATPHDLRRTFGSTVTGLGFGRPAMDRLLNHRDRSVGSIYDRHAYSREDQHIVEAVCTYFTSLVRGDKVATNVISLLPR
jgi:integrase